MLKYLVVISLFLSGNYVYAGDLPNFLYQIELNKPIHGIKNSTKTSMKGVYLIKPTKNQLPKPLTRLLVKVDSKTNTAKQIIGEAEFSKNSCATEAKKQKEKYEKEFSLQMEKMMHQDDMFYIANKGKKLFLVGCENKKKTILRVSLSSI